jgi:pyruvate/2-oxoglutarate dehydrogenase complex dihydrolipoamide dehydrogenase (E3) component
LSQTEGVSQLEEKTMTAFAISPDPVRVEPQDEHNRALVSNVHPPDWVNPEPAPSYNLVVIGAGTAGLVTAAGAAGLGARVALIERNLLGGDCLNVGCVPSKALIRSARAAADARNAREFGVTTEGPVQVDFPAVMERMRRLRSGISKHDSADRFRKLGVDVFLGEARFIGKNTVEVAGKSLRFRKAVIATGARAAHPPIPGLSEVGYLTNETVFSLTRLPPRLAVIGAGPIGCELAQAFQRFGSEVSLLEAQKQILTREDPDAAAIVQDALVKDGLKLVLGCRIGEVRKVRDEKVISFENDCPDLHVDEILVGAGRIPNVEKLNLKLVDVEYDLRSGVRVTERLQTSNSRIFAAGDVCFPYKFTHTADATARIVIQNALFPGRKKTSDLIIPWCTYTDPEVAHVGMYEAQARKKGIEVDTYLQPFESVDRAIADGEEEGFVKVHVKSGTDQILGATIVARHAGEMITELTLAMNLGAGLGKLSSVIHPYPTQAEAIRKAADAYNRTRLTPTVQRLFRKWLAWTR